MKQLCFIFALVITLLLPFSSHAEIFCVSDAMELQDALTTAASNGEDDTIQIEQGTYIGSFIYVSLEANSLTVEGGYTSGCGSRDKDPVNTVLDGNGAGSVLVFSTPDTVASLVVDGITLQNGVAGNGEGGGICAETGGNITISNSTITENFAGEDGGGVYAYTPYGTITFTNNTISENTASDNVGGIYAFSSGSITFTNNTITKNSAYNTGGVYAYTPYGTGTITFTSNTITENTADQIYGGVQAYSNRGDIIVLDNIISKNSAGVSDGGGIDMYTGYGTITFTNNTVSENSAGWGGGVMAYGTLTFTNNTISGNSAGWGGGVYADSSSSSTFTNNTITGNTASDMGGGIFAVSLGSITFTNNTITKNSAYEGGGVSSYSYGSITYCNNTISDNKAINDGGGIYIELTYNFALSQVDAVANIINNIIWNNTAISSSNDLYINDDFNGDSPQSKIKLYNNDFDQSDSGTFIQSPFPIDTSNINNEDPLFEDATNGDYHLTRLSPCKDTGRLEGAPSEDMDGDTRPQGDGVDIGADEFTPYSPPTTTTTIEGVSTTTTATNVACPSEALYGECSEETQLLRHFRDNVLSKTPEGRELTRLYYQWSPVIVKAMEEDEEFKKEVKEMISGILPLIRGEVK